METVLLAHLTMQKLVSALNLRGFQAGNRSIGYSATHVVPHVHRLSFMPPICDWSLFRCSSIGQRGDIENGAVNYTLIDAEKTQALQAANGERRRNPTGH